MSEGTAKYLSLTREQLYELVWSTPGRRLSAELEVSDVAIAKRCKKLNVPRPPRGYWAILTAGGKPQRPPLPPPQEELEAMALKKPVGRRLSLPRERTTMNPMAVELRKVLEASKPDSDKRVRASVRMLPKVTVTRGLAERAVQAVHAIVEAVDARLIPLRRARSSCGTAYFEKGNDRLVLEIEEVLVEQSQERLGRARAWDFRTSRVPSGYLTFFLRPSRYESYGYVRPPSALSETKQWSENDRCSLESVLAEVVRGVIQHYEAVAEQRELEAERWQRELEEEAIRSKQKQWEEHPGRLQAAVRHRMDDLVRAAVWWELHGTVAEFIRVCEQRWRQAQKGVLTPKQEGWLGWAREAALAMSPFPAGYPDPERDGAFDAAAIPVGGPYPEGRNLPDPPTFPGTPPPVTSPGYHEYGGSPEPKPYPFWIRRPKR